MRPELKKKRHKFNSGWKARQYLITEWKLKVYICFIIKNNFTI